MLKNFAVFASGHGSNLEAIIRAVKKGSIKARLALVVSDKSNAYALTRAKKANIKTLVVSSENFPDRESFDREVIKHLKDEKIDFIVLAGFMRILSAVFINEYRDRILNVHPALLPSFKGAHAIKDAFDHGVKVTGVTVHFVDEKVDNGAIILQQEVKVSPKDTLETLEEKIHRVEHKLYPQAISLFVRDKISASGRKVKTA
ncbi:MAG: phosphoribosylglycinamide formyltransferase [Candidatus Omnitrophota bacterium]